LPTSLPIKINEIVEEKFSRKSIIEEQLQELRQRQERIGKVSSTLEISRDQEAAASAASADLTKTRSPTGRHLLDKFSDSLAHVGSLLNQEYGYAARKVPAHMPHMIQRDVFAELHRKWESQFNATSSHKFRASDDMQFAFSYFYYLMHETKKHTARSFFTDKLDRNGDGLLEDFEIRYLALMFKDKKVKLEAIRGVNSTATKAATSPKASPSPAPAAETAATEDTTTASTNTSSSSTDEGDSWTSSKWSWSWNSDSSSGSSYTDDL
jgi:Stealth protein CR3, conserved region 3